MKILKRSGTFEVHIPPDVKPGFRKILRVNFPVFNKFVVFVSDDHNKLIKELRKCCQTEFITESDPGTQYGVTYSTEYPDKIIGIWLNAPKQKIDAKLANTIAHESVHAINTIFATAGVKTKPNNDETHAYHIGYLVEQITEWIIGG